MVKEPRAGRVKTRLGQEIGHIRAAWWMRHRLAALVRNVTAPGWDTLLAVAPDTAIRSPMLPRLPRLAQGPGDLGARMARVLRVLPPGPVLIIGADIPAITRAHIAAGFARLGDHDAVIGPATDGGFWAIGLKRSGAVPAGLFANVRWSTPHAMADTLASLPYCGIARLPELQDVDVAADLHAVGR
jgi:rSAM/selenodomain-associated transferase 1